MSTESERSTPLQTITRPTSTSCRNTFDTTTLALTDMEQANIAYGRNYLRLELPPAAFLPRPGSESGAGRIATAPVAVRIGADTLSTRLERARSVPLGRLLLRRDFIARDDSDRPQPISSARCSAREDPGRAQRSTTRSCTRLLGA